MAKGLNFNIKLKLRKEGKTPTSYLSMLKKLRSFTLFVRNFGVQNFLTFTLRIHGEVRKNIY